MKKRKSKNLKTTDPTKSAQVYKATLKSVGRTYKSEGETFEDALRGIKVSNGARAVSVLTVGSRDRSAFKILGKETTQRLFGAGSPTTREIHLNEIKKSFEV